MVLLFERINLDSKNILFVVVIYVVFGDIVKFCKYLCNCLKMPSLHKKLIAFLDLIEDIGKAIIKILLRFCQCDGKFGLVICSFCQIDPNGFFECWR